MHWSFTNLCVYLQILDINSRTTANNPSTRNGMLQNHSKHLLFWPYHNTVQDTIRQDVDIRACFLRAKFVFFFTTILQQKRLSGNKRTDNVSELTGMSFTKTQDIWRELVSNPKTTLGHENYDDDSFKTENFNIFLIIF